MSTATRRRRSKRPTSPGRKSTRPTAIHPIQGCDCPECVEPDLDPRKLLEDLLAIGAELAGADDPLDAEYAGATFMSMGAFDPAEFADVVVDAFVPAFEGRPDARTLALLLAIGSVAHGPAGAAAFAVADRLAGAGVPVPSWAADLRTPITVGDCLRLVDSEDAASMLVGTFHRAGRSHALLVGIDHLDCGAADQIFTFDETQLPGALEVIRANGRAEGLTIRTETLSPAEFRWQIEQALDARAVHDAELDEAELATSMIDIDGDGPGFHALALLARARIAALPTTGRPSVPHGGAFSALEMLAQFAGRDSRMIGPRRVKPASARAMMEALPARREKSDPPAPVFQIKVGLRGATPPIWRRLEVPADIGLDRLHTVIQVAFGWDNSHLYVFETPFGDFGIPDTQLGHRSDADVTLEQLAPAVKSKLRYTYNFGDEWEHDIVVEKVLDRTGSNSHPRCTGGRRAAPPEDCGGMPGYAGLLELLNDPADRRHDELLEWLGLDDPAEFDAETFDPRAVTRELSRVC